jgi:hypothetical protein
MKRTFAEGVDQLNRESDGLLRVEVIRKEDHSALAFAFLAGDRVAAARVKALLASQRFIQGMAKKKPALCLTCPNSVTDPDATLALIVAANDAATVGICSALCAHCSTGSAAAVLKRAADGYQAAWPGLRCVDPTHPEGGHA